MAKEALVKKNIRQILSNEVKVSGLRIVLSVYQGIDISELEWSRNRFFRFTNMDTLNSFHIRESKLTDLCFRFNTKFTWTVSHHSEVFVIANENMIVYKVGQKVMCYKFSDKQTVRIDNMHEKQAWNITRGYHYNEEELAIEYKLRKDYAKKYKIPSKPKNKKTAK